MTKVVFDLSGTSVVADTTQAIDLSIPLDFDGPQPNHFGALAASAAPLQAGAFTGDTRQGGSCNCEVLTLVPHCNGTHTECVGHVTAARVAVNDVAPTELLYALVLTVDPVRAEETRESTAPLPEPGDLLLTRRGLAAAVGTPPGKLCDALIVRTRPNAEDKRQRRYSDSKTVPYFTIEAIEWIAGHGVQHLIVDTPSIDRMHDGGALTAHRAFWGLPAASREFEAATRPNATITELAYIPDVVEDGDYLLNLQVAPFATDAAPSRPLLYRLSIDQHADALIDKQVSQ